ncbi:MAG: TetR/AcrR family transcriptional regulator [Acidimicrobiia bacterium]|nr:TetR/AcrR family transcriptional regulator [Acidimicrobiia bacterium]
MPRVPTVDPRIVRTREAVVAAASELLATEGIGRLTIDAIAQRSGVARSTIYRNWPERADLLLAAFESVARLDCPLTALGCSGDHLVGEDCGVPPPRTVEEFRRIVSEHARRIMALRESTLGGALAAIVAEAAHDEAISVALHRFGQARRVPLADAACQVIDVVGAKPRVGPPDAIERFVAPFFYRHLVSGETIDESFVNRQVELLLWDLGLIAVSGRS